MLDTLFFLLLVATAVVGLLYMHQSWLGSRANRKHSAIKRSLAGREVDNENCNVRAEASENLRFAGVPDFDAGDVLYNVPALDPQSEGVWQNDQVIITTSRIHQLTRDGAVNLELFELMAGGYVVLVKGPRKFLLKRYNLTESQENYLQKQRQDAADNQDGVIEDFLGKPWNIKMATGAAFDSSGPRCSSIQLLTSHPRLGEEGFISVLPPEIMDEKPHDYYDVEAVSDDGQVLVAFYCKGAWVCLIGRQMAPNEVANLHG